MKKTIQIAMIISSLFYSCSSKKQNVELNPFTIELISEYLKDKYNKHITPGSHVIKLSMSEGINSHSISIIGYQKSEITLNDDLFIGYCKLNKYDIYLYGKSISKFLKVHNHSNIDIQNKTHDYKKEQSNLYDPTEWEITIFRNNSLDEMHSFRINCYENIEIFKTIIKKHLEIESDTSFKNFNDTDSEVYSCVQEPPRYSMSIDSLKREIHKQVKLIDISILKNANRDLVIRFVVEKNGAITNPIVVNSSGAALFDKKFLLFVQKLPKLLPAKHRGKTVRAYFSLLIQTPTITN